MISNDDSARIIAYLLIFIIVGGCLAIVGGYLKAEKDCNDRGGVMLHAGTGNGYKCMKAEELR